MDLSALSLVAMLIGCIFAVHGWQMTFRTIEAGYGTTAMHPSGVITAVCFLICGIDMFCDSPTGGWLTHVIGAALIGGMTSKVWGSYRALWLAELERLKAVKPPS